MNDTGPLSPAEALARAHQSSTTVRRAGLRWRILGWWILTAFITVHMLGNRLFPEFLDDWTLVFLAVTMLTLGTLALTARVFERRATRVEAWFIVGTVVVTILLTLVYNLWIPDGVTVWAFLPPLLPVAMCVTATVWILRR